MNFVLNVFFIGEIIFILNLMIFLSYILLRQNILSYGLNINMLLKKNIFLNINFFYFCLFNFTYLFLFLFKIYDQNFFSFFFSLYTTEFINMIKLLIIFFTILIFYLSLNYILKDLKFQGFEFFLIINLSILGSLFLISSNDLMSFYLSLELQSLSFYVLAAFKQVSIFSIEAGLKYFVLGSFSSGIFIFGSSLLYGIFGSYNFSDIFFLIRYNEFFFFSNNFLNLGLLFFLITILFKISAVPFHMWAPDVYEGAPTIVTFFFSIIPKIVFLAFIIKITIQIFDFFFDNIVIYLIAASAIGSLILGSMVALIQKKIKRLFAYSSIANVGFLLIGPSTFMLDGFNASIIYLIIYSLIVSTLFYVLISLRYVHNDLKIKNIFELSGLLSANPLLCIFILVNLFSLIGIPPLAGFFGKFYLFISAFSSSLEVLFLTSLYASIISAVVYLRLIRIVFFNKINYFFAYSFNHNSLFFILSVISLINVFFFLNPALLFTIIYNNFYNLV